MNGRYLLDTNVVIALFAGEPKVLERLKQAKEVFVPCIVLGELYFGAYKSSSPEKNLARIDEFAMNVSVLGCDIDTARVYGLIKQELKKKGRPIPENDLWIAAIARQYNLTLATRDIHFQEISELLKEVW
ncbi:MAG TPA: type II toxin-antitoxin system VapC family toxin [Chloroflexi bacterium]|nr:type II toxin-antitoxin system VapC family toxin [Chloroflexota bacterium]